MDYFEGWKTILAPWAIGGGMLLLMLILTAVWVMVTFIRIEKHLRILSRAMNYIAYKVAKEAGDDVYLGGGR